MNNKSIGTQPSRQYRADIDGLRAIAVLLVICFHFEMFGLSGGFVGVDVFFVISGFLITDILYSEYKSSGAIDIPKFFARRIRRIAPAYIVTLAVTFCVATVVFPPQLLVQHSRTVIAALFFVSNISLWTEVGYFAFGAIYQPLLHTWSLGVEAQFYLIWPVVVLAVLASRRWLHPGKAIVSFTALAILIAFLYSEHRSATFFLSPFRAYEFLIGALCVFGNRAWPRHSSWQLALFAIGIFLITISSILFSESTKMPSVNALIPCIGAMLCIKCGMNPRLTRAFNVTGIAALGRVSYSLYLVHWPIWVFVNYVSEHELSLMSKGLLVFVSWLVAIILFKTVEQPFRSRSAHSGTFQISNQSMLRVLSCGVALTSVLAISAWWSGGWVSRLSEENLRLLRSMEARSAHIVGNCNYEVHGLPSGALSERIESCSDTNGPATLVVGDSHGVDIFNSLSVSNPSRHIVGLARGGCGTPFPVTCNYDLALSLLESYPGYISSVVFSHAGATLALPDGHNRFNEAGITEILDYLSLVSLSGKAVVWVGPVEDIGVDVRTLNYLWLTVAGVPFRTDPAIAELDEYLAEKVKENVQLLHYVSKRRAVRFSLKRDLIIDGQFTYSDRDHWSAVGEIYFGKRLMTNPTLKRVLEDPDPSSLQ